MKVVRKRAAAASRPPEPVSLVSLALRVLRGELSESQAIAILQRSDQGDLSDA